MRFWFVAVSVAFFLVQGCSGSSGSNSSNATSDCLKYCGTGFCVTLNGNNSFAGCCGNTAPFYCPSSNTCTPNATSCSAGLSAPGCC